MRGWFKRNENTKWVDFCLNDFSQLVPVLAWKSVGTSSSKHLVKIRPNIFVLTFSTGLKRDRTGSGLISFHVSSHLTCGGTRVWCVKRCVELTLFLNASPLMLMICTIVRFQTGPRFIVEFPASSQLMLSTTKQIFSSAILLLMRGFRGMVRPWADSHTLGNHLQPKMKQYRVLVGHWPTSTLHCSFQWHFIWLVAPAKWSIIRGTIHEQENRNGWAHFQLEVAT